MRTPVWIPEEAKLSRELQVKSFISFLSRKFESIVGVAAYKKCQQTKTNIWNFFERLKQKSLSNAKPSGHHYALNSFKTSAAKRESERDRDREEIEREEEKERKRERVCEENVCFWEGAIYFGQSIFHVGVATHLAAKFSATPIDRRRQGRARQPNRLKRSSCGSKVVICSWVDPHFQVNVMSTIILSMLLIMEATRFLRLI